MRTGPHPIRFFLLILPYGAAFGYASVALQWVATTREHIPVSEYGKVIALAFAVHGIKFLWAPLVDVTLAKRTWYLISMVLTLAGIMASAVMPISMETLGALQIVVMASQIGLTLMGMACENFMANLPAGEKGRAAGFYQAGNFLGLGLGGGLALELTTRLPERWMAAGILCVLLVPCALALIGLPEPPRAVHGFVETIKQLGRDLRDLIVERVQDRTSRPPATSAGYRDALAPRFRWVLSVVGLTGLFITLSPVGSGAAGNYWASLGVHWGASATLVGAVNGWLGGIVGAVGALVGGWLADRIPRRNAYALAGGCTALSGLLFALGPRLPWAYVGGVLVYTFFNGMAFGCFSAFVLETIGHGAVATKYNIFASLANLAVSYMTRIDGIAYDRYKETGLLVVDAVCTFVGIGVLFALIRGVHWLVGPRDPPVETPAPG